MKSNEKSPLIPSGMGGLFFMYSLTKKLQKMYYLGVIIMR
nr:MAG TPA: hypothetical protein [Caudoviricetes sp.]